MSVAGFEHEYLPATHQQYYIYVLKLENCKYYVGSTRSLEKRMIAHFTTGGAAATKESRALKLVRLILLQNYQIGKELAHSRLEVIVAAIVAKRHGKDNVRGAKHGKGWNSSPTKNDLRIVEKYNKWVRSANAKTLRTRIKFCDHVKMNSLVESKIRNIKNREIIGQANPADFY